MVRSPELLRTVSRIEAWLFDLDGVLTDTARVHAGAWKTTFDEVLARHCAGPDGSFRGFDAVEDYERYVDGRPRYDGVRAFLTSRGLTLPEGDPGDPPNLETVHGVGNRKNARVIERLAADATVFPGSVTLVKRLRAVRRRTAVVSASENGAAVLEATHIADLFDVTVDGRTAQREHLRGKPAPDTFLHAASLLGVEPARAAVIEDAPAGVTAGHSGHFGLVIGVARSASAATLSAMGADLVVGDLGELLDLVPEP